MSEFFASQELCSQPAFIRDTLINSIKHS